MERAILKSFAALTAAVCAVGMLCGCGRKVENQEPSSTEIREEILVLEMDIGAADIRLVESDRFSVETDNPYISIHVRSGRLIIREEPHIGNLEESNVTIAYPAGTCFQEVDLSIGASRLKMESLTCGELDLDLGAGQTEIHRLTVREEGSINGGAGQILIHSGEIRNLELKLGVGESRITALLPGNAEIEAGVGNLELIIPGPESDYTIRAGAGIGAVYVNGEMMGNKQRGNGPNRIELTGGVGQIRLTFSG